MRAALALLLLFAATASAQETALVKFRPASDPKDVQRGWLVECDQEGFFFERFGSSRRLRILWKNVLEQDRDQLRKRFRLDGSTATPGEIDGVRIHFKGGMVVEGKLDRIDEEGQYWVRRSGLLLPYPMDRIEKVEDIKIKETEVFSTKQRFVLTLMRRPPRDAPGHRALADFAFDIGEFRKAREHYRFALRLRPDWRPEIMPRLDEIAAYLKDAKVERELGIIKRAMRLDRDFKRAEARLKKLLERHPDKRSLIKIEDELKAGKRAWLQRRFPVVKHEEFKRVVQDYLRRKRPTIDQAMSWATSTLPETLRKRVRERMGISDAEFEEFSRVKVKGSPHWSNYWSATFVISKRAKKGPRSKRMVRGDPNSWWLTYSDTTTRGNFIQAYAAERLPNLFEVVQVKLRRCEKCGGTGRVKHVSLRSLDALNGGHQWFQTCPRCYGCRDDRIVGYR